MISMLDSGITKLISAFGGCYGAPNGQCAETFKMFGLTIGQSNIELKNGAAALVF